MSKRIYRQVWHLILLVIISSAIIACGPMIKDADTPETDKAIVFGKVEVVSEGGIVEWDECGFAQHMVCPDEFELLLISNNDTEPMRYKLKGTGSFIWNLTPGHYTIAEFAWIKYGPKRIRSGRVWAEFDVSNNQSTIYLGTLVILFIDRQYILGYRNDYEKQKQILHSRVGKNIPISTVSLFSLDKRQESSASSYICGEQWGITCTDKIHGVTPIYPSLDAAERFTKIDDLLPVLKWKPSSQKDVTYDVVVYEALRHQKDIATVIYMPGKVVEYKEGLVEPSYAVSTQLNKTTKYYWSVRLRRNKTVTTWSTENYSSVGIAPGVFWVTKGAGQLYGFSTP